jgi:hypothetical protein
VHSLLFRRCNVPVTAYVSSKGLYRLHHVVVFLCVHAVHLGLNACIRQLISGREDVCISVQVAMESNGKGVDINGQPLKFKAGEVDFGEPGTNGQHSFYQLIHQGRPVPAEFIGVVRSQQSVYLKGEIVSNHDELMCNFFAQADALAVGKDAIELRSENVPDALIPHKTFTGNRPSMSIMLPELNAYTVGQLLAMYENRVAVQVIYPPINDYLDCATIPGSCCMLSDGS